MTIGEHSDDVEICRQFMLNVESVDSNEDGEHSDDVEICRQSMLNVESVESNEDGRTQ